MPITERFINCGKTETFINLRNNVYYIIREMLIKREENYV